MRDAVKGELDLEVQDWKPDVVLVTSRGEAAGWAYSLDNNPAYAGKEENIGEANSLG